MRTKAIGIDPELIDETCPYCQRESQAKIGWNLCAGCGRYFRVEET